MFSLLPCVPMAGPEARQTLKAMLKTHALAGNSTVRTLNFLMIYWTIWREAIWLVCWSTKSCTILICLGLYRFSILFQCFNITLSIVSQLMQDFNHPEVMQKAVSQGFPLNKVGLLQSSFTQRFCNLLVTSLSPPGAPCIAENENGHVVCFFGWNRALMDRIWLTNWGLDRWAVTIFIFTSFGTVFWWPRLACDQPMAWWNQVCLWSDERTKNYKGNDPIWPWEFFFSNLGGVKYQQLDRVCLV